MTKLLDILEVIVPYKHFHKLRQFVDLKLPPGFPVKLSEHTSTTCTIYRVYVCIYECTYLCMYVCMYLHTYVCVYCVSTHVCMYLLYICTVCMAMYGTDVNVLLKITT